MTQHQGPALVPTGEAVEAAARHLGPRGRELRAGIDELVATLNRADADGLPIPPVAVPTINQLGMIFAIVAGAEASRGSAFVKGSTL